MISERSDWQKTLLLAGLIEEWEVVGCRFDDDSPVLWYDICDDVNLLMRVFLSEDDVGENHSTLYEPDNMHLAWRLAGWAWGCNHLVPYKTLIDGRWTKFERPFRNMFFFWWTYHDGLIGEQAARAQRLWLDKVLELAVAAGMVDGSKFEFLGDDDERQG